MRGLLLRRIAAALGYSPSPRPEPESVRLTRRLAEQLNDHAAKFHRVASRIVLLEQRVTWLDGDSATWEKRAKSPAVLGDPDLGREVARICGRIEGQRESARDELHQLRAEERHLLELLTRGRRDFVSLLEDIQTLGHDVSRLVLNIDLTRPEAPADPAVIPDDEAEFIGRVVDSHGVH